MSSIPRSLRDIRLISNFQYCAIQGCLLTLPGENHHTQNFDGGLVMVANYVAGDFFRNGVPRRQHIRKLLGHGIHQNTASTVNSHTVRLHNL